MSYKITTFDCIFQLKLTKIMTNKRTQILYAYLLQSHDKLHPQK